MIFGIFFLLFGKRNLTTMNSSGKKNANPKKMVFNMPSSRYGFGYSKGSSFQNTPTTKSYQYLPTRGITKSYRRR